MPKFVPIKDYETQYEISDEGVIRCIGRFTRKEFLSATGAQRGYALRVSLNKPGNRVTSYRLDKLVAEHHVPNPNKYRYVHNISGDKNDVSAANLEYRNYPPTRSVYTQAEIAEIAKNYLDNVDEPFTTYAKRFKLSSGMLRRYVQDWADENGRGEEYTEKMSANRATSVDSARAHILKPVLQYTPEGVFLREFPSVSAAANSIGVTKSTLSRSINKTSHILLGGFKWKFK